MEPKHQAIAAGLALTLTFGAVQAPVLAYGDKPAEQSSTANGDSTDAPSESDPLTAGDSADAQTGALPEPGDYDRADFYRESSSSAAAFSLRSAPATRLAPKTLSWEMKYFAQNESGSNYDKGWSYYDGYNALGFYQFDRRFALVPFLQGCYNYNPVKYGMFKAVLDRADELRSGAIYKDGKLTEIARMTETAWHAAYAADPAEFSALQDGYGYTNYYLPVERALKANYGVDISKRYDCVKGLCWGMSNLFGTGGSQYFFKRANLTEDMTDEEMVTAICDSVVDNIKDYSSQTQYYDGWISRYKREKKTCLNYIKQHRAEEKEDASKPGGSTGTEVPGGSGDTGGAGDSSDSSGSNGSGSTGAPDKGDAGDAGSDSGAGDGGSSGDSGVGGGTDDGGKPGDDGSGGDGEADGSGKPDDGGSDEGSGGSAGSDDESEGSGGSGNQAPPAGDDGVGSGDSPGAGDSAGDADSSDGSNSEGSGSGNGSDTGNGSGSADDGTQDDGADAESGVNGGSGSGSSEGGSSIGDDGAGKTDGDGDRETDPKPDAKRDDSSGNGGKDSGRNDKSDLGNGKDDPDSEDEKGLPQTFDPLSFVPAVSLGVGMFGAGLAYTGVSGLRQKKDAAGKDGGDEDAAGFDD